MLAERRRKQNYSTDPRGLNWANDDSKFGQKLMEKMGWQKGKGLGANENGRTEHVAVTMKDDTRGVGCSKNYADNWIEQQQDFESLLSQLNDNQNTLTETSLQNLEKKSQQTKARVHYKKFVKGKDLSNAKQDDLDSIFGKRKNDSAVRAMNDQSDAVNLEDGKNLNGDVGTKNDYTFGVTTVCNGTSVAEYFARKMSEMKSRVCERMKLDTAPVDGELVVGVNGLAENESVELELENVNGLQKTEPHQSQVDKLNCKSKRVKSKHKKRSGNSSPVTVAALDVEDVADGESVNRKKAKKERECSLSDLKNTLELDDGNKHWDSCHGKKKKRHSASLSNEDKKSTDRKKSRKKTDPSLEPKNSNEVGIGNEDGESCHGKKYKDRHCAAVTEPSDVLDEKKNYTDRKKRGKKRDFTSLELENSRELDSGNEDGESCRQKKSKKNIHSVSSKEANMVLDDVETSTGRKKSRKNVDSCLELEDTSELDIENEEGEKYNQTKGSKKKGKNTGELDIDSEEGEKCNQKKARKKKRKNTDVLDFESEEGEKCNKKKGSKKKRKNTSELDIENEEGEKGRKNNHVQSFTEADVVLNEEEQSTGESEPQGKKHKKKSEQNEIPLDGQTNDGKCIKDRIDEVTTDGITVDRCSSSHREQKRLNENVSVQRISKVVTSLFPGCNLTDVPGYGCNR